MREAAWSPIPGYEGHYEISTLGEVVSLKRGGRHSMVPLRQTSGHLGVSLCLNGVKKRHRVHVLVALTFIGPRPFGMEVRHLDGVHQHNTLANLAYGTPSENRLDAYRHDARPTGQASHLAKISDAQAKELMGLQGKVSSREAALRYGLDSSYVRQMWRGESRRHTRA